MKEYIMTDKFLDNLTITGKTISINIEIVNSELAKQLLGTMYNEEQVKLFGVKVKSWGFDDILAANERKLSKIAQEVERSNTTITSILDGNIND